MLQPRGPASGLAQGRRRGLCSRIGRIRGRAPQEVGVGDSAVKRLVAALVICVVGAAVSGLLLMQHHGEAGAVSAVNQACGDGQTSGCEEVARSSWSRIAGMPLAAIGLFFYLSLALFLLLAALGPAESRAPLAALAMIALALALAIDLGLLALQAFAIKAFCKLCLATYALNVAALAVLWPARPAAGALRTAAPPPAGRLVIAPWAVATLAVAGGGIGSEAALTARQAHRPATLVRH